LGENHTGNERDREEPCGRDRRASNNSPSLEGRGLRGGCKKKLSNTLSLTLPPQGGGAYKVTLWQDHRELKFIK